MAEDMAPTVSIAAPQVEIGNSAILMTGGKRKWEDWSYDDKSKQKRLGATSLSLFPGAASLMRVSVCSGTTTGGEATAVATGGSHSC